MGIALHFLITVKGCIYESKLAHIGKDLDNGIFKIQLIRWFLV